MIKVESLHRSFGKVQALQGISFKAAAGRIIGLIGPNGAGKTTAMRILATLETPDNGQAWIDGHPVSEEPDQIVLKVGFMPDCFGNYPGLRVHEYLEFFARIYGLHGATRRKILDEVINFTELTKLLDRPMEGLSKGMRQRLGLAKTLLHDPKVLILDEPAAGLDPRARIEFRELCVALAGRGKTLLISSHILSELGEFCDSIVILEQGRVVAAGSMAEVQQQSRPHMEIAARFLMEKPGIQTLLAESPFVRNVHLDGRLTRFAFTGNEEQLGELAAQLIESGHRFSTFHCVEERLEDVFMKLTRGDVQ
ncbi:MAG: ABC transporter ATP-binding protein [Verrucomicrobiae bacterium]|nr:ABC transporter ATP-binding protein [Verrucomicrobiae bacterium]